MKVLITGSEGNIGSVLVPYLEKIGHEVHRTDIVQRCADNYDVVDVNNPADLGSAFARFNPDICIHLAAVVSRVTSERSPSIAVQTNVSGTQNVITLCRIHQTKLMYFSTSEVYGNTGGKLYEEGIELKPNNIYGLTKLLGEQLVKYAVSAGLDAIILRPFMFYHEDETIGDHRSAMIRFVSDLIRGKKITVHEGSRRSWMHLNDAVYVIEKLMHVEGFDIINVGSREDISTAVLALEICQRLNIDFAVAVDIVPLPDRMTLTKTPNLEKQTDIVGICTPQISISEGIDRVINSVKKRI